MRPSLRSIAALTLVVAGVPACAINGVPVTSMLQQAAQNQRSRDGQPSSSSSSPSSSSSSSSSASSSSGEAPSEDDLHRAEGVKRAEEIKALDDATVADIAAKELLGLLNTVEARKDDPNDATDWATGKLSPLYVAEARALKERYTALVMKKYGGSSADEVYGKILPALLCVERLRFEGRLDDKGEKDCHQGHRGYEGWSGNDPLKAALLLEAVLPVMSADDQKNVRLAFVNTFGYARKSYKWESLDTTSPSVLNRDTYWGVALEDVPVSGWTYRTVRYAHDYAKRHGVEAATVKKLAGWLPKVRRHRCRSLEGVYFIQRHEGGGKYGRPEVGMWDLSGAEEVDCKAAGKAKSTSWALKLVKKTDRYERTVDKWLGAKVTEDWRAELNDLGIPVRKIAEATLTWREEF